MADTLPGVSPIYQAAALTAVEEALNFVVTKGQTGPWLLNLVTLRNHLQDTLEFSTSSGGGGDALSVMSFATAAETAALNGTDILERALTSAATELYVPDGVELVVNAIDGLKTRLIGRTLRGPGTIRFTAGNLRLGSGARVRGLKVRGTGKTNAGSGLSILAGSSDIRILNNDIREIHYNGVNINGGTSNITVAGNIIKDCGGAGINRAYQGCGIYGSGTTGGCSDIRVYQNEISDIQGQGGVFFQTAKLLDISHNTITRTYNRGVCLTGQVVAAVNDGCTGRVSHNFITKCGEVNTIFDAVTGLGNGVGCNGIFVNLTKNAYDVVAYENFIDTVAENCIEGRLTVLNNFMLRSGAYPKLITPSIEGLYLTGESAARGNTIVLAEGAGIYMFDSTSRTGGLILDNTIVSSKKAGVRVLAGGTAAAPNVILSKGLVRGNVIYGDNAPTEPGVECAIGDNAYGSFSDFRVVLNDVFGRSGNPMHSSVSQRLNSWQ
jgi:hypothetical protein